MYILDVLETCNNPSLSAFLYVTKNVLLLIEIIVPAALLIGGTVEFVRLSINPEDKKGFRKILNKVIAALIVFMIPVLINAVMGIVGESTEFTSCWVNAEWDPDPRNATYIDDDDKPSSSVIDNPEDYE
jgi:hypothetical protein